MTTEYDGKERRSHCMKHEENTTDIASLKASAATLKWVIGIGMGALLLALSAVGSMLSGISNDTKQAAIASVETRAEIKYLTQRFDTHERNGK